MEKMGIVSKKKKKKKKGRKKLSIKEKKLARIATVQKKRGQKRKVKKTKGLQIKFNKLHFVNINFCRSNFFMNLHEIMKGSLWGASSGLFGFKGRKRNKYHSVVAHIIRFIRRISFFSDIYPILLWKGVPRRLYRAVLKTFKFTNCSNELSWQGIIAYLFISFNGCRRKKLKRK